MQNTDSLATCTIKHAMKSTVLFKITLAIWLIYPSLSPAAPTHFQSNTEIYETSFFSRHILNQNNKNLKMKI